jgi:plastocyanin
MRRRRLLCSTAALSSLAVSMFLGAIAAQANAGPRTYVIGVDAAGPARHNFEYVDYFPRGQVVPNDPPAVVGNGATIDFRYNLGSLDGLHTAALLPFGETPGQAWAQQPLLTGDEAEATPPPNLILNTDALFQSPSNCGGSSNPCVYTGTSEVNSGALPAFTPSGDFFVRINLPTSTPTTVHYVCLIHPGMQGNIRVVPGSGSSPAAFASNAASQWAADTAGALTAETQADNTAVEANGDGTNTVTMTAGTATQFVEVAEMLPRNVTVRAGDTVKWVTLTQKDPHTVSFPDLQENFSPQDPIQLVCEGATGDTAATGPPPDFGCGSNPTEFTVDLFPQGPGQISSSSTLASSGVIATFDGLPDNHSFSFPNAGTFSYQCRIHDHMNGTITVTP